MKMDASSTGSSTLESVVGNSTLWHTISTPSTITPNTTLASTLGPFEHLALDGYITPSPGIIVKSTRELPISLHMDDEWSC